MGALLDFLLQIAARAISFREKYNIDLPYSRIFLSTAEKLSILPCLEDSSSDTIRSGPNYDVESEQLKRLLRELSKGKLYIMGFIPVKYHTR